LITGGLFFILVVEQPNYSVLEAEDLFGRNLDSVTMRRLMAENFNGLLETRLKIFMVEVVLSRLF
jgi:hypothetical protein